MVYDLKKKSSLTRLVVEGDLSVFHSLGTLSFKVYLKFRWLEVTLFRKRPLFTIGHLVIRPLGFGDDFSREDVRCVSGKCTRSGHLNHGIEVLELVDHLVRQELFKYGEFLA